MAKYSQEFKLNLVQEYNNGECSGTSLSKKTGITSSLIYKWIKLFNEKGVDSLKRARGNNKYSQDFKIKIVKEYLSSNISYNDLAIKYDINNSSIITRWKLDYEKYGIMGLQEKKKGRPPIMPNNISKKDKRTNIEKLDDKLRIKDLEMKLEINRAQNALLKKYLALGIPIPESMLEEK